MNFEELQQHLKKIRIAKNVTYQELADAVGISKQSVVNMEKKVGVCSFDNVMRVCRYLKIKIGLGDFD